ncbi:MAG TPA: single-stranded DNA-binding protein [Bacteroidales bacterium]|nr:single-stranded DNA-binding protein [Bacteroidales bacterium]
MNSLKNRVQLIGHLGMDPELKTLESGKKVSHFTFATDDSYKNTDGQKVNETTWHNIVAWNGVAELTEKHLKKGKKIFLEGRIIYRSYEDKNKVTKYITEIVMNDFLFLDTLKNNGKVPASKEE